MRRTPPPRLVVFVAFAKLCDRLFPLRQLTADMGLLERFRQSSPRYLISGLTIEENNNPFRVKRNGPIRFGAGKQADDDADFRNTCFIAAFSIDLCVASCRTVRYNDLNAMARAENVLCCAASDYVLKQQKLLLRAK